MCRYGMSQINSEGIRLPVKKPTGWMTNAVCIARGLQKQCKRDHQHTSLEGKQRTERAQVYSQMLCAAIITGLIKQLKRDGRMPEGNVSAVTPMDEDRKDAPTWNDPNAWGEELWDDISGIKLDPNLMRIARAEEIKIFRHKNVCPLEWRWV